jgi:hypothetical protein
MTQTVNMESTRAWLQFAAQVSRANAERAGNPLRYTSYADFILRHGRAYEWHPFPGRLARGVPRACYRNAARLALRSARYIYVEGCAVAPKLGISIDHAWCIDQGGHVVDPTWDDGRDYFGVAFRTDYLRRVVRANRQYGLIYNVKMDLPLLTGEHSVEEALAI